MHILFDSLSAETKAVVDCLEVAAGLSSPTKEQVLSVINTELVTIEQQLSTSSNTANDLLDYLNRLNNAKAALTRNFI